MSSQEQVGYGRPPQSGRFRKGQSGNPKGRPRGRHRDLPHDHVLGQMVTIREDGRTRRVTAAEAFLLQLTNKGLEGNSAAARSSLEAIEAAREKRRARAEPIQFVITFIDIGFSTILAPLGIGIKKYASDEQRVRWELQPWIVEAALARLDGRRLTIAEQREVWANTRTPHKVNWPEWWVVRG